MKLVERTTRSVALTSVGRRFLPQARRILGDLGAALVEIRETAKAQRGDVSIACVPTVGVQYLPRILQEYSARHPQNRIEILDHSSAGVADAVLRREAEFGIQIAGSLIPSSERAAGRGPLRAGLPRRSPARGAETARWRQLEPYPLIFAGEASGNRPLLQDALRAQRLGLHALYEVQRSSTAVGLVAEGVGAAVVPSLAMQKGALSAPARRAADRPGRLPDPGGDFAEDRPPVARRAGAPRPDPRRPSIVTPGFPARAAPRRVRPRAGPAPTTEECAMEFVLIMLVDREAPEDPSIYPEMGRLRGRARGQRQAARRRAAAPGGPRVRA